MEFFDAKKMAEFWMPMVKPRMEAIFAHGKFINGPEVAALEQRLAALTGRCHAIGVSSGTDALLLCLLALYVGPGDLVLVPSFTFAAAVEAVIFVGARPVFVDCDATFNVTARMIQKQLDRLGIKKPKACIVADMFGYPADFPPIERLCADADIVLIEDAAQSFGATRAGRFAGKFGQLAITSFFPTKPLGCFGDGGMVFTDDPVLENRIRSLRAHGTGEHKYKHVRIGMNARLDTLQAAVLLGMTDRGMSKLTDVDLTRCQTASVYCDELKKTELLPKIVAEEYEGECAWAQFTCLTPSGFNRGPLLQALATKGIPTAVHYPTPLHKQPAYRECTPLPPRCPNAEEFAERVFQLPMHGYLSKTEARKIGKVVAKVAK